MALINNLWVHVTDEKWSSNVTSTSHSVEKGLPLTDTVRNEPCGLSLTGLIVDAGGMKATAIVNKLEEIKKAGSLITYSGRKSVSNMQIQSFNYSHSNAVWGGCKFDMELKEVRIAKKAYVPAKTGTDTSAKPSTKVTVKVGSIVKFKGGKVYVSSDAKTAAATRGASTCKCTKINTKSWAKHPYHLISTDGKKVYGWVDKADVEGTVNQSKTNSTAKSGTQQPTAGSSDSIYHKVKKGDTIWALVNKTYKEAGTTVQWVIDNNPSAFSKKGDARTLKVGARLLIKK